MCRVLLDALCSPRRPSPARPGTETQRLSTCLTQVCVSGTELCALRKTCERMTEGQSRQRGKHSPPWGSSGDIGHRSPGPLPCPLLPKEALSRAVNWATQGGHPSRDRGGGASQREALGGLLAAPEEVAAQGPSPSPWARGRRREPGARGFRGCGQLSCSEPGRMGQAARAEDQAAAEPGLGHRLWGRPHLLRAQRARWGAGPATGRGVGSTLVTSGMGVPTEEGKG